MGSVLRCRCGCLVARGGLGAFGSGLGLRSGRLDGCCGSHGRGRPRAGRQRHGHAGRSGVKDADERGRAVQVAVLITGSIRAIVAAAAHQRTSDHINLHSTRARFAIVAAIRELVTKAIRSAQAVAGVNVGIATGVGFALGQVDTGATARNTPRARSAALRLAALAVLAAAARAIGIVTGAWTKVGRTAQTVARAAVGIDGARLVADRIRTAVGSGATGCDRVAVVRAGR